MFICLEILKLSLKVNIKGGIKKEKYVENEMDRQGEIRPWMRKGEEKNTVFNNKELKEDNVNGCEAAGRMVRETKRAFEVEGDYNRCEGEWHYEELPTGNKVHGREGLKTQPSDTNNGTQDAAHARSHTRCTRTPCIAPSFTSSNEPTSSPVLSHLSIAFTIILLV